jgi:hypothetical protein
MPIPVSSVLLMKLKAGSDTFQYNARYWTDSSVLNETGGASVSDSDNADVKMSAFSTFPISALTLCYKSLNNCYTYELGATYTSAQSLFSSGFIRSPNLGYGSGTADAGKRAWTDLFLPPTESDTFTWYDTFWHGTGGGKCAMQRPGINVRCNGRNRARIGYCVNIPSQSCQSNDDDDADSPVGIGLRTQNWPYRVNAPFGQNFISGASASDLRRFQHQAWLFGREPLEGQICDAGMLGTDCAFNAVQYFVVTAVLWILTALPLLAWATPCLRRQWSASRAARVSLLFVAASALCCFADGMLAATTVIYGNQTLWTVGSILLVFGICVFSTTWCDVASATIGLHSSDQGWRRLITRMRLTYVWMAVLHVPFALMFSVHDYRDIVSHETFETMVMVWGAWLVFGTLVVLSGLAFVQCYIARVCLAGVDGARSLQKTALINVIQQLLVDVVVIIYAALYASTLLGKRKYEGSNVAAYHSLGFIAFLAMHVQVVLFFAILGNTDPMYSQSEFDQLLSKAEGLTHDIPASVVGSNSVDNAA